MRKLATLILAAAVALSQVGCGQPYQPRAISLATSQMGELDFGPYPTDYKEIILQLIKDHYKDPDSARVEFLDEPKKATQDGLDRLPMYGWGGSVRINAKNSYGAYTGYKTHEYLIWKGHVILFGGDRNVEGDFYQRMPNAGPNFQIGVPSSKLRFF